jgi:hypothetical protein
VDVIMKLTERIRELEQENAQLRAEPSARRRAPAAETAR